MSVTTTGVMPAKFGSVLGQFVKIQVMLGHTRIDALGPAQCGVQEPFLVINIIGGLGLLGTVG
jgi:hypothetical protein